MKTALIATDFSSASHNALVYGVAFARAINAKIILFNAYLISGPAPGINLIGKKQYHVIKQTHKQLRNEADLFDPKQTTIEIQCAEGIATDTVINIANKENADFIIVGMKGSGKTLKKIFGSITIGLAEKTNIPVIIVPEKATFKNLETMVFVNDALALDKGVPKYITQIARLFKSRLYAIRVIKNEKEFEVNAPRLLRKTEPVTTFEYSVDADISFALNTFIEMNKADILVMLPHKHAWLKRLFIKSEAKGMIFHSHVPLLIIPEKYLSESYSMDRWKNKQRVPV